VGNNVFVASHVSDGDSPPSEPYYSGDGRPSDLFRFLSLDHIQAKAQGAIMAAAMFSGLSLCLLALALCRRHGETVQVGPVFFDPKATDNEKLTKCKSSDSESVAHLPHNSAPRNSKTVEILDGGIEACDGGAPEPSAHSHGCNKTDLDLAC